VFTKSAALEFARKGYWIRVNSIHPGTTESDMEIRCWRCGRAISAPTIEPARQQALMRIPIGRMGNVTDIARGILFPVSDDTAFMTGSGLVVDGGITAQ
jgi:3(or 17)beta-hydroxysteroid dehydrogenase